jgi:hypothetical protein
MRSTHLASLAAAAAAVIGTALPAEAIDTLGSPAPIAA